MHAQTEDSAKTNPMLLILKVFYLKKETSKENSHHAPIAICIKLKSKVQYANQPAI